ncbi:hypothetical protein F5Y19DRAFT_87061 [Xylariaceae sp. FL1651]|nr:hypothetical protein F5Y19DRAFT_87061 [Xylariaceae sp. FL1651]
MIKSRLCKPIRQLRCELTGVSMCDRDSPRRSWSIKSEKIVLSSENTRVHTTLLLGKREELLKMADQADTVELTEEVQETFVLHNRTFQRYAINNNTYFVPVDEDETLRLRIQHHVLTMMFDNRFMFPPITAPRRILDCGFGTGEVSSALLSFDTP